MTPQQSGSTSRRLRRQMLQTCRIRDCDLPGSPSWWEGSCVRDRTRYASSKSDLQARTFFVTPSSINFTVKVRFLSSAFNTFYLRLVRNSRSMAFSLGSSALTSAARTQRSMPGLGPARHCMITPIGSALSQQKGSSCKSFTVSLIRREFFLSS